MAKRNAEMAKPDPTALLRELVDTVRRIDNMKYLMSFKERRRDELIDGLRKTIGRSEARVDFIDFDARRNPKTATWCIRCQKDILPGEDHLEVRLILTENGAWPNAMHADDELLYDLGILTVAGDDRGRVPIGRDCARKQGKGWTMPRRETKQHAPKVGMGKTDGEEK